MDFMFFSVLLFVLNLDLCHTQPLSSSSISNTSYRPGFNIDVSGLTAYSLTGPQGTPLLHQMATAAAPK